VSITYATGMIVKYPGGGIKKIAQPAMINNAIVFDETPEMGINRLTQCQQGFGIAGRYWQQHSEPSRIKAVVAGSLGKFFQS